MVIVPRTFGMDHQPVAGLMDMFVKGRLEPAFAQGAARDPFRCQSHHLGMHVARGKIGRTEQHFERARRPAPFGQCRPFEHDGPGIGARHVETWPHWVKD
jgi:hypothetical protein